MVSKIVLDYLIIKINNIHFGIILGSWQRNKGLRIDHFLISDKISTKIKNVEIDKFTRGLNKPSDHAPIRVIF